MALALETFIRAIARRGPAKFRSRELAVEACMSRLMTAWNGRAAGQLFASR